MSTLWDGEPAQPANELFAGAFEVTRPEIAALRAKGARLRFVESGPRGLGQGSWTAI
jgi:hypothetical protein